MTLKFFETHAHLDYLKEFSLEEILQKSHTAGVDKIITIAVDPNNQDEALSLAHKYDEIYCTQGLHPHEAKFWDESLEKKIRKNLKFPKVKAIGEIGLDYHYDNSPRDIQRQVFEAQLQIVIDSELPVVIHTREAEEDTQAILKNFLPLMKKRGVIHSFTSSENLANFALQEGFYLGFNGIVTFKAAENVRDVLRITPIDRILLETDCPFLAPIPFRGRENQPFYIPYIAKKVAETKCLAVEDLAAQLWNNAEKVFFNQKF